MRDERAEKLYPVQIYFKYSSMAGWLGFSKKNN
jgi:hypothetical protein